MRVLIAIDSWKGCLTSHEANEAARRGVLTRWPDADVQCFPVSDGGEGFLDAVAPLRPPKGGGAWQRITVDVLDPLLRPVRADYLFSPPDGGVEGGYAVIEMARASGLQLLKPEERNPLIASSYGTGQLIADALRRGATDVLIGLGGSATSDCGRGMLEALRPHLPAPPSLRITIATDVTNPLLGPDGATYVFAPQKASPSLSQEALACMLTELESRSVAFASANAKQHGRDCSQAPGAGAAGGLGYALMQYFDARRVSGAERIIGNLPLTPSQGGDIDFLITGEGRADRQTLMGKLPFAILQKAKAQGIPVVLLAGQVDDRQTLLDAGFSQVLCVNPPDSPLAECLRPDIAASRIREALSR